MHLLRTMSLSIPLALCILGTDCRHTQQVNLHDRIAASQTNRYCHLPDACFNPHVLAIETPESR